MLLVTLPNFNLLSTFRNNGLWRLSLGCFGSHLDSHSSSSLAFSEVSRTKVAKEQKKKKLCTKKATIIVS